MDPPGVRRARPASARATVKAVRDVDPGPRERAPERELAWVDGVVHAAALAARLLPALVAPDAVKERARAVAALERGGSFEPAATAPKQRVERALFQRLSLARRCAREVATPALAALYLARI
jgi:hypothetical protein